MSASAHSDYPPEAATYLRDYSDGRYDDDAQIGFIYSSQEARLSEDGHVFYIGRPDVDGIEFAYRRGHPGIWAWYPIDADWVRVAPDIETLERDWFARKLTV
ncbi:MAG: hypothetical protein HKN18_15995 [Silicimonas sp.]|nr:hypothetical protein [Silicimonas sp.]